MFCLYVCLYEGARSSGTVSTDSCQLPCGCRDVNPDPRRSQCLRTLNALDHWATYSPFLSPLHLLTTSVFHYRFGLTYLSVVTWMFSSELSSEQLLVLSTLIITCLCTSLADYRRMILRPYKYKYIDGSLITCPFRKILEVFTLSLKVHKLVTSQIIGLWPNL